MRALSAPLPSDEAPPFFLTAPSLLFVLLRNIPPRRDILRSGANAAKSAENMAKEVLALRRRAKMLVEEVCK
jgi:hypothetical protein